jgi:Fic family protein
MTYIHENKHWPTFTWDQASVSAALSHVRHRQGRLLGQMESLGFSLQQEATLGAITQDVLKSSQIEGENLDQAQVHSSVARRLGIDIAGLVPSDRNVDGVVDLMLDATQHYAQPLTQERLFGWHASLFPTGRSGFAKILVASWRKGPMQVISGPIGRERVHFVAPSADRLENEMSRFLAWFQTDTTQDPVLKAAIAHFWFITIHPFDDGNGRLARAIADMALARSEQSGQRFYSMSSQIQRQREDYYRILETSQKSGLDITPWMLWFLSCLDNAFTAADQTLASVLIKARFWAAYVQEPLSPRQRMMLTRLLEGFEGNLTSSKWAKLTKCSHDTASRDIQDLLTRGILIKNPGAGRSTSYRLADPKQ